MSQIITIQEKRLALIKALRRDARLHQQALFDQMGKDFDKLDVETTGKFENTTVQQTFPIAWNFWDSWLDERNHLFPGFYEGIAKNDWPDHGIRLAEQLESGHEVENASLLKHFLLRPSIPLREKVRRWWLKHLPWVTT